MKKIAMIYDYDGTLAPGNIQEPALLPLLLDENETIGDFWRSCNAQGAATNSAFAYCTSLIERAQRKNIKLTKDLLFKCGSKSRPYPSARTWFKRINEFAKQYDVEIKHFIISSGNKELLIGSPLASNFEKIFGCEFEFYDGEAISCRSWIDDTGKIEYINKIHDLGYEYTHMLYFGDGLSDLGAMRQVNTPGGYTFGIYEKNLDNIKRLENNGILKLSFDAQNCYKAGGKMERIVKEIILDLLSEQLSLF